MADGDAFLTFNEVETDAPVAHDALIYEATTRFVVGMSGGEGFAFVFDGTDWKSEAIDKPVSEWTAADFDAFEAAHPTLDDGSAWVNLGAGEDETANDTTVAVAEHADDPVIFDAPDAHQFQFAPLTIDMGTFAPADHLLVA